MKLENQLTYLQTVNVPMLLCYLIEFQCKNLSSLLTVNLLCMILRMGRVLKTVQSYGDYDRLCQGVHENYLHMKMRDSRFQSVSSVFNKY